MLSHESFISDWKLFNNILISLFFSLRHARLSSAGSTWTPHDISMHNLFVCALVSALATMQLHITHTWSIISRPDFKEKSLRGSIPILDFHEGENWCKLCIFCSVCMGKKLTNKQSSMRTSVQLSTMICRQRLRNLCYLKHVFWCLLIKIVENIDGENIFWVEIWTLKTFDKWYDVITRVGPISKKSI